MTFAILLFVQFWPFETILSLWPFKPLSNFKGEAVEAALLYRSNLGQTTFVWFFCRRPQRPKSKLFSSWLGIFCNKRTRLANTGLSMLPNYSVTKIVPYNFLQERVGKWLLKCIGYMGPGWTGHAFVHSRRDLGCLTNRANLVMSPDRIPTMKTTNWMDRI